MATYVHMYALCTMQVLFVAEIDPYSFINSFFVYNTYVLSHYMHMYMIPFQIFCIIISGI